MRKLLNVLYVTTPDAYVTETGEMWWFVLSKKRERGSRFTFWKASSASIIRE